MRFEKMKVQLPDLESFDPDGKDKSILSEL